MNLHERSKANRRISSAVGVRSIKAMSGISCSVETLSTLLRQPVADVFSRFTSQCSGTSPGHSTPLRFLSRAGQVLQAVWRATPSCVAADANRASSDQRE